jgi:hypothetical protein
MDALGEASVLDHARHDQIFHGDEIKFVDNVAAVVREVLAFPLCSLMRACDHLAAHLAVLACGPLLRVQAHRLPEIRLIQLGMRLRYALGHAGSSSFVRIQGQLMLTLRPSQCPFFTPKEA